MYMIERHKCPGCTYSSWEGTNLDEDVEPLSELDVGHDQVTDEPTQLFIELVDLILDVYQCRSK